MSKGRQILMADESDMLGHVKCSNDKGLLMKVFTSGVQLSSCQNWSHDVIKSSGQSRNWQCRPLKVARMDSMPVRLLNGLQNEPCTELQS